MPGEPSEKAKESYKKTKKKVKKLQKTENKEFIDRLAILSEWLTLLGGCSKAIAGTLIGFGGYIIAKGRQLAIIHVLRDIEHQKVMDEMEKHIQKIEDQVEYMKKLIDEMEKLLGA